MHFSDNRGGSSPRLAVIIAELSGRAAVEQYRMRGKPIDIPEADLRALYGEQRLSAAEIAERYHCCHTTVLRRLRTMGIAIRSRAESLRRFHIPERELRALYREQRLSLAQIAARYGCSPHAVRRRLQELKIPVRSASQVVRRWRGIDVQQKDFSGDPLEQAYLVGFRTGDLTVSRFNAAGETVAVAGHSTQRAQVDLIDRLFAGYGYGRTAVYVDRFGRTAYQMRYSLNATFAFLLDKPDHVPPLILSDDQRFMAFFADYVDADGSFGLMSRGTWSCGRFQLSSTDKDLLDQCREKLCVLGVRGSRLRLKRLAGHTNRHGITSRKDYWAFQVVSKQSLSCLIALLEPYLQHAGRRRDLQRVQDNLSWRQSDAFRVAATENRRRAHAQITLPEAALRSLYVEQGHTAIEIAEVYNCSEHTVLQRLHRLGIPRRRTGPRPKAISLSG